MSYCQWAALLDEPDTSGAATAGSNYQRNCWALRQRGALSGAQVTAVTLGKKDAALGSCPAAGMSAQP